jgi:hypothetical protein
MPTVDIKCPVGPQKLLMRLKLDGKRPSIVEGNLLELNCDECKKNMRRQRMAVVRVLHRYDLLGRLIETEVVTPDKQD